MQTNVPETVQVLIVEADPNMGMLIDHVLQVQGFRTLRAADGLAAKELVDTRPAPKLVLLSLALPFLDGNRLLSHIRRTNRGWSETPVIMLPGRSNPQDLARALQGGATVSLGSPVDLDELLSHVRRHIRSAPTSNRVTRDLPSSDDVDPRRSASRH